MSISLKTVIRSYQTSDSAGLFNIATDRVFTWLPYGAFNNEIDLRYFYEQLSGKCELFTVLNDSLSTIYGIFALKNISQVHKKCEIGHIWYAEQYQKTHINTEAMFLALRECFDQHKFRRVAWKCDRKNTDSVRCALRLGFRYEGISLNDQIVKGNNKDTAWFALIDRDWSQLKQNFLAFFSNPSHQSLAEINATDLEQVMQSMGHSRYTR